MKLAVVLVLGCLFACAPEMTRAASIVKATYSQDGETIGQMIYTGPDGGPRSDPAKYWALLGKAPEITSAVKIEPDKEGGRTATLKGDIEISVEIRNQFNMGTVQTDMLSLVRDDGRSDAWYIPAKELERIQALLLRAENMPKLRSPGPAQD